MVPIGDIANSLPRFNLTNRYSESGMEYRAVREIKVGEQVYFNYDTDIANMVTFYNSYGFILEDEFTQPLEVKFSLTQGFPLFATAYEAG